LLAPTFCSGWSSLIVLPHLDLTVLSLRQRCTRASTSSTWYRTFIEEPLYWHTFVLAMSILATVAGLLAFSIAWTIAD
jgi:spermidine/putrescine transport system permease protein